LPTGVVVRQFSFLPADIEMQKSPIADIVELPEISWLLFVSK
jgi:hypothetical protein